MAALSSNAPLFPGMEPIVNCLRGIAREVENDTDSGSDSSIKEECIAMGKPPQGISMTGSWSNVENDPYCLEDYYQMVADAHADGEAEGYDFVADLPTKEEWIAGFDVCMSRSLSTAR